MKRLFVICTGMCLAASLSAATLDADASAESLVAPGVISETTPGSTNYGCCWRYFFGIWICVPC